MKRRRRREEGIHVDAHQPDNLLEEKICPVKVCRMTRNGLLIFLSQYRRHHAIICNLVPFPSPSKVPTKVIAHFIFKMFLVSLTVRYITGMKNHSTNACAVETVSKNVCNQNTKIII